MLQHLEFVRIQEKNIGTYKKMNEVSVRIPYELIKRIICQDFNMIEHVLQDMLQCHVTECVTVYDCKTGLHLVKLLGSAKFVEDIKIFIHSVSGIQLYNFIIEAFSTRLVSLKHIQVCLCIHVWIV